jgi:HSP20 family protein
MTLRNLIPNGKKDIAVRKDADNPVAVLRHEVDSIFDNFFRGFGFDQLESSFPAFNPKVDVTETEKEIKIYAELPGMDEKDIEVCLEKDTLVIKGEKKQESEQKEKDYHRVERTYGTFSRRIHLPVEVETDKIDAKLKKGVLTIHLPKSAKIIDNAKKIHVKAE